MARVSIVITNYNYGRFLPAAIDSALAVRCDDKEVIVCDDGSTDDSREVIERYRHRLTKVIYKENGGQPSAANVAFEHVTGEIVFFLDSDDMYLPQIAEKVLAVWRPGVTKVQFPMYNTDKDGVPNGTMFPNFTVSFSPEYIREQLIETGLYPTTPTTGNAYARDFLKHIFPVPERLTEGFDSFMNPVAPLYGDVLTLLEPLALYRIHGRNSWAQDTFNPAKLTFYVQQDFLRTDYLQRFADRLDVKLRPQPLNHNPVHLMFRLGCLRATDPASYPVPNETRFTILGYALPSIFHQKGVSAKAKMLLVVWFLGVAFSPKPLALYLIRLRFVALSRPRFFLKAMRLLGIMRSERPSGLVVPHA